MTLKLSSTDKKITLDHFIAEFEDRYEELGAVISLTESKNDLWTMEIYFDEGCDEATIKDYVAQLQKKITYTIYPLPEKDWVRESQKNLNPITAGRFFVHGSHDTAQKPAHGHSIKIDAATAFGTGHHGTTKGCLLALDILSKKRRFSRILDMGCGSAILAIASAKIYKTTILASDIDPQAVHVARENARDNGVHNYVHTFTAAGFHAPQIALCGPYDLILANILPKPLCAMAQDMRAHTKPGSTLVLSGILDTQNQMVEALFRARGFHLSKRLKLGEWITLILFRK